MGSACKTNDAKKDMISDYFFKTFDTSIAILISVI